MKKTTPNKTIGILGGMGPVASANLYHHIISYSQNEYGAVQDNEYPPVILYSLPLDGFDETGIVDDELVCKQLIEGVQTLEKAGCNLIIVACNTVHYFYKEMQASVTIPILSMIQVVCDQVAAGGYQNVGLLCSESTNQLNLYKQPLTANNVTLLSPTSAQQAKLNQVIEHVMGGHQNTTDVLTLKEIIRNYTMQGAEAIILGCTELPIAINQTHTDITLFDTLEIVTKAAVDFAHHN